MARGRDVFDATRGPGHEGILGGSVAVVRCRLFGREHRQHYRRYIRHTEFALWRHLMESRHGRAVLPEAVSLWIPETRARLVRGLPTEACDPVMRVCLRLHDRSWLPLLVERFLAAEDLEPGRAALLSHYGDHVGPDGIRMTPGYFLPPLVEGPDEL